MTNAHKAIVVILALPVILNCSVASSSAIGGNYSDVMASRGGNHHLLTTIDEGRTVYDVVETPAILAASLPAISPSWHNASCSGPIPGLSNLGQNWAVLPNFVEPRQRGSPVKDMTNPRLQLRREAPLYRANSVISGEAPSNVLGPSASWAHIFTSKLVRHYRQSRLLSVLAHSLTQFLLFRTSSRSSRSAPLFG